MQLRLGTSITVESNGHGFGPLPLFSCVSFSKKCHLSGHFPLNSEYGNTEHSYLVMPHGLGKDDTYQQGHLVYRWIGIEYLFDLNIMNSRVAFIAHRILNGGTVTSEPDFTDTFP